MSRAVRLRRPMFFAVCGLFSFAMIVSSDRARAKPANPLEIVTGFSAKESCSCAFVVDQSDEYCTAFGKPPGFDVAITIDRKAAAVTSSFGGVTRVAHMHDGEGCTVDALP